MTYLLTQLYTFPNCIDVVKRNDKYGYDLRKIANVTFKYSGRIVKFDTVWLSFLSNAKAN